MVPDLLLFEQIRTQMSEPASIDDVNGTDQVGFRLSRRLSYNSLRAMHDKISTRDVGLLNVFKKVFILI